MNYSDIEEQLYQRAIRTTIRPPLADRVRGFGNHRTVSMTAIGIIALCASLAVVSDQPGLISNISNQMTRTELKPTPAPDRAADAPDRDDRVLTAIARARV